MASFTAYAEHRHKVIPFNLAQDANTGGNKLIKALIGNVLGLKLFTRTSPQFESLRAVYNLLVTAQPLVICRPQSIAQIQGIVKTVAGSGTQIAVRCGGHDVWGRGCVADSVLIDMREMDTQVLAEDKQSITVGGGTTSDNFVGFLDTHGLCTAQGTAGQVGWTGWAMSGGYGLFMDYIGLGVDNMVGAKVVTADGNVVQADEELLWGIRGAGGSLGIVVETQVKVYPLAKTIAGFIAYAWDDAEKVLLGLQALLDEGVPDAFCVQMGWMKSEWGLSMTLLFFWPDPDVEEGWKWMNKAASLGTVVVNTTKESKMPLIDQNSPYCYLSSDNLYMHTNVTSATYQQFQNIITEPLNEPANVYTRGISFSRFTPATISRLLKQTEAIPDGRQHNMVAHIVHGKGARPNVASCFGTRKPHVLLHINAIGETSEMKDSAAWADEVVSSINATGEAITPPYVSFMGEDEDTRETFGPNWERLKALKKRVDGTNIFSTAQPKIPVE
ncbi:hypothetical protein QQS21_000001 [Conoideocrella luteorostrata]|uniref:FAD-binding PCMH-type domain-containing protein n=1 Tax=Conoideocrella luteorostrata TaxID=1105319 RepID=A0AAJ0G484_9HYPO|nr:hypothetical protein QQS21_000001 [Conoideocrella luteorostrata]